KLTVPVPGLPRGEADTRLVANVTAIDDHSNNVIARVIGVLARNELNQELDRVSVSAVEVLSDTILGPLRKTLNGRVTAGIVRNFDTNAVRLIIEANKRHATTGEVVVRADADLKTRLICASLRLDGERRLEDLIGQRLTRSGCDRWRVCLATEVAGRY